MDKKLDQLSIGAAFDAVEDLEQTNNPHYFGLLDVAMQYKPICEDCQCAPVAPPIDGLHTISCADSQSSFICKTDLGSLTIEARIGDSGWMDISDIPYIEFTHRPGNPGGDLSISLTNYVVDERLHIRFSRPVGLYVNEARGINQINDNSAYTLFDAEGNVIDPYDPENHDYSGSDFDDTDTAEDYAVFFSSVMVCLSMRPV